MSSTRSTQSSRRRRPRRTTYSALSLSQHSNAIGPATAAVLPLSQSTRASKKSKLHNDNDDSLLLLRLAEACQMHHDKHVRHTCSPQTCQESIQSLSSVVPCVEAAVRTTEHWYHVCIFYQHVMAGAFCPRAPELFQHGRGGVESEYSTHSCIMIMPLE
jgi:hypothetical protein